MEETLISLETTKLAKEKKFVFKREYILLPIYIENNFYRTDGHKYGDVQIPTQSYLQKYLREVHNIELYVIPIFKEKCGYDSFKRAGFGFEIIRPTPCQYLDWTDFEQCKEERDAILNDEDYKDDLDIQTKFKTFQTYEEALEIGLQEALKLI